MNLPSHGANPHLLYKSFNLPLPEKWIDFSVNTNPYPLPPDAIPTQEEFYRWMTEYPDPDASELSSYLAKLDKVDKEQLLIANGASQCIYLLAQLFSGKRVGIFEPTFSEYRAACEGNGCEITSIHTNEERSWSYRQAELAELMKQVDVIFLCQPNNPTGTVLMEEELYHLLELAEKEKTFVIIDEAFYHFWENSFTALQWILTFPHLIVIRSLTKMYHLAGIRIGYMVANEEIIGKLKAIQPPWSVNQVAQQFSLRLLRMNTFVEETKQNIVRERERVTAVLQEAGYYVSPSVVNFYLLRAPFRQTEQLMHDMLKVGLIPRHTVNFRGLDGKYLRLAVKTKEENDRLLDFLAGVKR